MLEVKTVLTVKFISTIDHLPLMHNKKCILQPSPPPQKKPFFCNGINFLKYLIYRIYQLKYAYNSEAFFNFLVVSNLNGYLTSYEFLAFTPKGQKGEGKKELWLIIMDDDKFFIVQIKRGMEQADED